jgi:hypothetical protein
MVLLGDLVMGSKILESNDDEIILCWYEILLQSDHSLEQESRHHVQQVRV